MAAMIRSYFPQLSAIQVKEIILKSVWKPNDVSIKYVIPNRDTDKSLTEVSTTGGIVNAANAIALAKTYKISITQNNDKKKKTKN
jgi:hypothetical protein